MVISNCSILVAGFWLFNWRNKTENLERRGTQQSLKMVYYKLYL